jgi:hypothetical protein
MESWTHRDWMENPLCSSSSRNPQAFAENKLQTKIKRKITPRTKSDPHAEKLTEIDWNALTSCFPPRTKQERRRSGVVDIPRGSPPPPCRQDPPGLPKKNRTNMLMSVFPRKICDPWRWILLTSVCYSRLGLRFPPREVVGGGRKRNHRENRRVSGEAEEP